MIFRGGIAGRAALTGNHSSAAPWHRQGRLARRRARLVASLGALVMVLEAMPWPERIRWVTLQRLAGQGLALAVQVRGWQAGVWARNASMRRPALNGGARWLTPGPRR